MSTTARVSEEVKERTRDLADQTRQAVEAVVESVKDRAIDKARTVAEAVQDKVVDVDPEPLSLQYTNLLHQFRAPNAPQVREFRRKHKGDKVFLHRARKLDALFMMSKIVRSS